MFMSICYKQLARRICRLCLIYGQPCPNSQRIAAGKSLITKLDDSPPAH
jgi:hypothetical protein